MTRNFKAGDRVSYPMNGVTETGTIIGPCGAPNNESGTCYIIESDRGVDNIHKRTEYLSLAPQNLDILAGKVDEALDRLEAVEGRVDTLEQAGGTPLVETTATTPPAAQNPTRKFKIGDQVEYTPFGGSLTQRKVVELCAANDKCYALSGGVHVNESILRPYSPKRFKVGDRVQVTEPSATKFGKIGVIESVNLKGEWWDYDYRVNFANRTGDWGFNDDELELAPYEFKVGDVVRVNLPGHSSNGSERVIIEALDFRGSNYLNYQAALPGQGKGFWYRKVELTLLRTAEEDAKLKADEQAALKQRALNALDRLSFQEEMDVREYLKGESE